MNQEAGPSAEGRDRRATDAAVARRQPADVTIETTSVEPLLRIALGEL